MKYFPTLFHLGFCFYILPFLTSTNYVLSIVSNLTIFCKCQRDKFLNSEKNKQVNERMFEMCISTNHLKKIEN